MKSTSFCFALAGAAAVFSAGCSHLDLTSNGNPSRVLTGSVDVPQNAQVPSDAVLVVRVIDPHPDVPAPPLLTSAQRSAPPPPPMPEVLGEQTLQGLGETPYRFRIEYVADDEQLRKGLNIEARISSGGHLVYSNTSSYTVGLTDVNDPHSILLDRAGGP